MRASAVPFRPDSPEAADERLAALLAPLLQAPVPERLTRLVDELETAYVRAAVLEAQG